MIIINGKLKIELDIIAWFFNKIFLIASIIGFFTCFYNNIKLDNITILSSLIQEIIYGGKFKCQLLNI